MSLRDQAKQSIPKVLRTSFSQANALGQYFARIKFIFETKFDLKINF